MALAVGASFAAQGAAAQECESDEDCGPAFRCSFGDSTDSASVDDGSAGGGTAGETNGSEAKPVQGEPAPDEFVPSEGSGSGSGSSGGSGGAASSEDTAPCADCDVAEMPLPTGMCEQDGIACSGNSECPEPATCEGGECVYRLVKCSQDSECDSGYVCTVIDSGRCSTSGDNVPPPAGQPVAVSSTQQADPGTASDPKAPASAEAGGDQSGDESERAVPVSSGGEEPTPDAPDAPTSPDGPTPGGVDAETTSDVEVTCEQDDVKVCFPAPVACTEDDECQEGWSCKEVPPGGPDAWDELENACFPPGLVALLDKKIDAVGEGVGSSEEDGSATGDPKGEDGSDNEVPQPPIPQDTSMPNLGTQGGSEGAAGCGVASPRSNALPGLGLALAALALLRRRRHSA